MTLYFHFLTIMNNAEMDNIIQFHRNIQDYTNIYINIYIYRCICSTYSALGKFVLRYTNHKFRLFRCIVTVLKLPGREFKVTRSTDSGVRFLRLRILKLIFLILS